MRQVRYLDSHSGSTAPQAKNFSTERAYEAWLDANLHRENIELVGIS